MSEEFLQLDAREQAEIYRALAPQLARSTAVLEKDVWVCWALKTIFSMPGRLRMAFKGGTSLSKVFNAIERFSEDVDITLDYRALNENFDPFGDGLSKSRLKKLSDELKAFVSEHVRAVVAPYFEESLSAEFDAGRCRLEVSGDGEQLLVHYRTVLDASGGYVANRVLVEFGGRNITEPNEEHDVRPDIAPLATALQYPCARVCVLSPARTFWEKATLIHVECQRTEFRQGAERLSRHWYDLTMLTGLAIGEAALADRALLADVVRHKKVFFNSGSANYDACLDGQLRLIPNDTVLPALREDYLRMIEAGMFTRQPPEFDFIVHRLRDLEDAINRAVPAQN